MVSKSSTNNANVQRNVQRGDGYLVAHLDASPTVPCPCGQSTRIITRQDTPVCNVHVTHIRDAQRHYHKQCTEIYYVLEGEGVMELNGDHVPVRPGTVIVIEPGTRHRLTGDVRTIVFGVPALDPSDEYFD